MRALLTLLLLSLGAPLPLGAQAHTPAHAQRPDDFVGTWELLSIERRSESGEWAPARFSGAAPVGILMYDANGNMAAQITTDPRLTTMPPDASAEWTNGYVAYYAAYDVNAAGGFITHYRRNHVNQETSDFPVVRYFDFAGDTLTLTVAPDRVTRLRWLRMRQQMARGAAGEFVVPIRQEPRHRPVFETAELQILDIGFNPGDTTLFHRHDAPVAYVQISWSRTNAQVLGRSWGSVDRAASPTAVGTIRIDESFPAAPTEHRVTNVGDGPFRLIAVINRGPGAQPVSGGPIGSAGPAETASRWFRSTHHTLTGGAAWEWSALDRPVVVVQVAPGSLGVELESGAARSLRGPGDFIVVPAGTRATFRGDGTGTVTLAIVEVR